MDTLSIDKFIEYCEITCIKDLNHFAKITDLTSEDVKNLAEHISKQKKTYSRKRIVAIGFRLGLTASDVNFIMRACGRPILYARNLVELTLSYSLNTHHRYKAMYRENTGAAVKNWWKLYQSAVEIYNSDSQTADCLTSGAITLNRLKQFDQENRSVAADSIYHPVTADASRMTSFAQRAAVATDDADFLEIVKELAPKLREQRSNARLIFVRYLYYYIEGMMQYYSYHTDRASIPAGLFDHIGSKGESLIQLVKRDYQSGDYKELQISISGVIKRMYWYYWPIGEGFVAGYPGGIPEDTSEAGERLLKILEEAAARLPEDDSVRDTDCLTGTEIKYLGNEVDYYTDVLRGTCDLTRERLLFFLTFVNSILIRDNILPDFQDDIVLDENRLSSILERCYGVVLSNEKDKLAMRILQIQHKNPGRNDDITEFEDPSLNELTLGVLERDDLADEKPMGRTTTNTYGGKLQKDIVGKPED